MASNAAAKSGAINDSSSAEQHSNPFNTLFDDDDTEDEWWDEDDSTASTPNANGIRAADFPRPPQNVGLGVTVRPENRLSKKMEKRYSVQKPTRDKSRGRQRKQNARAGIKVVTNFSRHQAAAPPVQLQPSRTMPQMGKFVDLAALKALTGESSQSSGGSWRIKKTKPNTMPSLSNKGAPLASIKPSHHNANLNPSPVRANEDLSPDDRPIVIGLSIPSADLAEHNTSPQTAISDTTKILRSYEHRTPTNKTPDTPTIIITPAQEISVWSASTMSPESACVYTSYDAPPVPVMPASFLEDERQRVAAQRSYFSPDSDDVTTWGEDEAVKSRIVSSCTVFEEDESPVMVRSGRAVSVAAGSRMDRHASISTVATRRRSRGWWNYITTPFLTRSNTFAAREVGQNDAPALPSLAAAAFKAQGVERDGKMWEKQFSPLTPATSTTISTDAWWDPDAKQKLDEQSPVVQDTRHKVSDSTGTLPIVFSETAIFDAVTMSSLSSENHLVRENTTSSIESSHSSEREVPVLSSAPNTLALQSNNPFNQTRSNNPTNASTEMNPVNNDPARATRPVAPGQPTPPPPYSPSPGRVKYKAVFPLGHALGVQYPGSPGPLSPGMQQAMSSSGAIPMSEVPLTPPGRRPINLNSGYPELPARQAPVPISGEHYGLPPTKATKAEAKRRRHEKEDAVARKAGGWWRGRGCISDRGCYGRSGAEGRKRRRWYLGLVIGFLTMIIVVVVLATTLHRKSNTVIEPSQWLNLTGFPPIFLGVSTIIAPANTVANTGCVFPATQWSCSLPKEIQGPVAPNPSNRPNFFVHIQWDNSSVTNATFANVTRNPSLPIRSLVGNPVSAGALIKHLILKARQAVTFIPSPPPPSFAEEAFLGNSTDGIVSKTKAGEPTPFYISFLSNLNATIERRQIVERATNPFPNLTSIIPPPSSNGDGTAAAANLLPFPVQQPIRLYDRGLPTEHYGFFTFFDRSIFLKSLDLLNETNTINGESPADKDGGAKISEAVYRCTWSQTRYLVQIWTRMNETAQLLTDTLNKTATGAASRLVQPGSFPYPVTITTDRHGGDPAKKMIYCYSLDGREKLISTTGILNGENRGFGGAIFNPAPSIFSNGSNPSLGGVDGGTGGCSCQWNNFQKLTRL